MVYFKKLFIRIKNLFSEGIHALHSQRDDQDDDEKLLVPIPIPRDKRSLYLRLRQARQDQKKDLYYIATTLKIRAEYLEALEEGQYELLPKEGPYALGYVKAYAQYLQLDVQDIVDIFKQEWPHFEDDVDFSFWGQAGRPHSFAQNHILMRHRLLIFFSVALIVGLLWATGILRRQDLALKEREKRGKQALDFLDPLSTAPVPQQKANTISHFPPVILEDAPNDDKGEKKSLKREVSLAEIQESLLTKTQKMRQSEEESPESEKVFVEKDQRNTNDKNEEE